MHYVSFNFGHNLGELRSLLTVFLILVLCGTCAQVQFSSSTDRFHSSCHMAGMTSFENHLLFKSFHIGTA